MPKTCELCRFKDYDPSFYQPYQKWASRFIPENGINVLFIAESPSYHLKERAYIYNTNYVGRRQFVLRGLIRALGLDKEPIAATLTPQRKEAILRKFQGSGYFLVDAAKCSVNQIKHSALRDAVIKSCSDTFLYRRTEELQRSKGIRKVVVMKYNVYDVVANELARLFPEQFVKRRIPFPCCGWQNKFVNEVKAIAT